MWPRQGSWAVQLAAGAWVMALQDRRLRAEGVGHTDVNHAARAHAAPLSHACAGHCWCCMASVAAASLPALPDVPKASDITLPYVVQHAREVAGIGMSVVAAGVLVMAVLALFGNCGLQSGSSSGAAEEVYAPATATVTVQTHARKVCAWSGEGVSCVPTPAHMCAHVHAMLYSTHARTVQHCMHALVQRPACAALLHAACCTRSASRANSFMDECSWRSGPCGAAAASQWQWGAHSGL